MTTTPVIRRRPTHGPRRPIGPGCGRPEFSLSPQRTLSDGQLQKMIGLHPGFDKATAHRFRLDAGRSASPDKIILAAHPLL